MFCIVLVRLNNKPLIRNTTFYVFIIKGQKKSVWSILIFTICDTDQQNDYIYTAYKSMYIQGYILYNHALVGYSNIYTKMCKEKLQQ